MSSETLQRIGKYTYIYESTSFRDSQGRPRNTKQRIGKIDPKTGRKIYKQEYLDKMAARGTPIAIPPTDAIVTLSNDGIYSTIVSAFDTLANYGAYYFLRSISDKIGMATILNEIIPDYWKEVFTLACFLICSERPVMYCEDWVSETKTLPVGSMSSQRISELLVAFGVGERNFFYTLWGKHISEQEYIALDITSISSYSELMQECEWGYNRDHEDLPQINLCMLMGEKSRLPVFQTVYSGSIKDVSTLINTLKEVSALIPAKEMQIVMDKGFFSTKNINAMLDDREERYRFIIAVPFTHGFAKKQVESERKDIDQPSKTILTDDAPIRGVHKVRTWVNGKKVHSHILYNPVKALKERNDLYGYVTGLMRLANENPENKEYRSEFEKYLIIRKSDKTPSGYTINLREDVIAEKESTTGWMVLISNHMEDTQEVYDIYRTKDVVEKGFNRLKNCLNLGRLHVHSVERMQNKIFIGFIALIIMSHIHRVMSENNLYKQMTMDKLLINLSKIKIVTINGRQIIRPLTKVQKRIFKIFGIELPVG